MSFSIASKFSLGPLSTSLNLDAGQPNANRERYARAVNSDQNVSRAAAAWSQAVSQHGESSGNALQALIAALNASSNSSLRNIGQQLNAACEDAYDDADGGSDPSAQAAIGQLLNQLGLGGSNNAGSGNTSSNSYSGTDTGRPSQPFARTEQGSSRHSHFNLNTSAGINF